MINVSNDVLPLASNSSIYSEPSDTCTRDSCALVAPKLLPSLESTPNPFQLVVVPFNSHTPFTNLGTEVSDACLELSQVL